MKGMKGIENVNKNSTFFGCCSGTKPSNECTNNSDVIGVLNCYSLYLYKSNAGVFISFFFVFFSKISIPLIKFLLSIGFS